MQVTIKISDKVIKTAIGNALDNEVYEYYSSSVLKAAKVAKIATAINAIFEDPKFQAQLAKEIKETAESAVEENIYDMMDEISIPQITTLSEMCKAAEEVGYAAEQERKDAEEVTRMISLLKKAGFKISKE